MLVLGYLWRGVDWDILGHGQEGSFWVFFLRFGLGFGLVWSNNNKGN